MNQRSRKYKITSGALLSLLTSLILFTSVHAQTAEQTIAFARQQMSEGHYEQAVNALNRVFYFDNGVHHPEVLPLLADNSFLTSDFESARNFYDISYNQEKNDSIKTEYFIKKVLCSIRKADYTEAIGDLYSNTIEADSNQQWNIDLMTGLVLFHLEKYDESKNHFLKCADSSQKQNIDEEFARIRKIEKRYRPGLAGIMSIVLPGSGQIYCGDYKNGLNSLFLLGGLLGSAVLLSVPYTFIDASIIVLPWFQRYYIGGYKKASVIALNRQNEKKGQVLLDILDTLQ